MKKQIYIEGLGYRDPISEKEQVIWFLLNYSKRYKGSHYTRFWNDLLLNYEQKLISLQAFELLKLLKEKANIEAIKKREQNSLLAKVNAQLEIEAIEDDLKRRQSIRELISKIRLN